jgi:peptide-methionine (S)-S-oxide reductase
MYLQSISRWITLAGIMVVGIAIMASYGKSQAPNQTSVNTKPATDGGKKVKTEKAILAGGCFWGMEELFRKQPGVLSTRVGYSGGDVKNATYRNHGTHAEAIEVVYDPNETDFRRILEFFFQIHDPTTKNRQGNDRGASYRSAIYYNSDEQKRVALDTIEDVNASGLWPGKVVTEVEPVGDFWEAEPSGLFSPYPQRLHLPLPTQRLGIAKANKPKPVDGDPIKIVLVLVLVLSETVLVLVREPLSSTSTSTD